METQVSGTAANQVCNGFKFKQHVRVEAVGFSGGIWLLWNKENVNLQVLTVHDHFIHTRICLDVEQEVENIMEPLFIGGDFNCIVTLDEHQGGANSLSIDTNRFLEWVDKMELIDMGFSSTRFTWTRGLSVDNRVCKRRDKGFVNLAGRLRWEEGAVRHLPIVCSDHCPIFCHLNSRNIPSDFENPSWLLHPNFLDFVGENWKSKSGTLHALNDMKNKAVFGSIHRRESELVARIEGIQKALKSRCRQGLLELETKLWSELNLTLEQEETLWFQKSREKWISQGDRNTSFSTLAPLFRRNNISTLRIDEDTWITDAMKLEGMAVDFFFRLYTLREADLQFAPMMRSGFPATGVANRDLLDKTPSQQEIRGALKQMGLFKAPGIDGFQPVFFKACWKFMGANVVSVINEFINNCRLPTGVNDITIALIGKVQSHEMIQ
ncbi:LOW QUALITY PROTEIN: hypothetical protein V2J09_000475 [Rumex salicifolius]